MTQLALILLLLMLSACSRPSGSVPTVPTVPSGPGTQWSDPQTWGGKVPDGNSAVTVPAGKTVVLDVSASVKSVTVLGNLIWADKDGLELTTGYLMVHGPGLFRIGAEAAPFSKRATLTLSGNDPSENIMGMGTKFLGAMMGGKIEIWGEQRVSWTQLNATAAKGATQLTLKEAVDWRPGEKIVVASTALDPSQAEERTVTAVSASSVTLDKPLDFAHFGQTQTFAGKTLDSRAEVGLLSRNVVIQGDTGSVAGKFGGHVMVMGADPTRRETSAAMRGSARIQGVEFRRLGQFDRLGRYPFHWHQNGDSAGDFVRGSSFHSNLQRGVVIHGTDNAVVETNVVYGSVGHSYSVEDGSESGNRLEGNLGLSTRPFAKKASNPLQAAQNDDQAATFWIRGANNRWVGNHAAGGEDTAFWFDDVGRADPARLEFRGNAAHSYLVDGNRGGELCCEGFEKAALWFTGEGYDTPYRGPFPVTQMTLYKNRTALWGNPLSVAQGFADVRLSDSILADNLMGLNSHGARDTVIVGRSANPDAVGSVGAQGIQEYGHTQRLENVTFVNFPGGGAIAHRNCDREAGNATLVGVRLVNAKISLCQHNGQHSSDMAIADTTGSILGGGPVTLTPAPDASRAMYTSDCAVNAGLGVRVCNGLLGYANLHQRGANASLTRDDGATLAEADVDTYPFYWTVIEGRRYTLNGDVAAQATVEFSLMGKYEDEQQDRSAVVRLAATSSFAVFGQTVDWFSPTDRNGQRPLPQAASLGALEASPSTAYFYDSAARVIHLKLWTGEANRVFVDRR